MSWTPEKIEKLVELWEKDYSASEIADQLGATTRNAVISKANRLGLSKKANKNRKPEEQKSGLLTLYDIGESMCKWPNGDPQEAGFHFCGDPCFENLPYCDEHALKAYHTITKKRMTEAKKAKSKAKVA